MLQSKRKWETPLYITIFALILVLLFKNFLFDPSTILADRHSDRIKDLGIKTPIETSMREEGHIPQWNPSVLGGMPTVDATAGDILYPLSLPFAYTMPLVRAEGFKMILHVFFAGIAMFLLLKYSFRTTRFTAFIGGLFYMLNPQLFSHFLPGHDGKMFVIAWLPIIVWCVRSLMHAPTILKTTFLAAAVSMSILTSHVQMTYFVLWGIFAYWIFFSICRYREEKNIKKILPQAGAFWSAMVLVLIIGGIQLFPAYSYVMDGWSVRGENTGIDFVASWSLHWPEFFSLWVPDFGNWLKYYWSENPFKLNTEYVGAIATLLAVLALITRPTGKRFFWFGVGIFAVLISMGTHTPLLSLAYHTIPGVNRFRALSMIMFWFSFSTILLACLFLKDITTGFFTGLSREKLLRTEKATYIVLAVCTGLFFLFLNENFVYSLMKNLTDSLPEKEQVFRRNFSDNFVDALTGWFVMALTTLILFILLLKNKIPVQIFLGTVLILGLVDTLRVNSNFIRIENSTPYTQADPQIQSLQREMEEEPFRVLFLPGVTQIQNIAGIYNLEGLSGFHDNELETYRAFRGPGSQEYIMPHLNSRRDNYDIPSLRRGSNRPNIANCKYFIARTRDGFYPIENSNYLPRLSFTKDYRVVDDEKAQQLLHDPVFNSRKTVLLEEAPPFEARPIKDPAVETRWKEYTADYRRAEITIPEEGMLRIAEVYYPGWNIRVNGEDAKIYRSDITWMAIHVPSGTHTITMEADSLYLSSILPYAGTAAAVILLYWLYCLATVLIPRIREKMRR
jgi:hypothetical protein